VCVCVCLARCRRVHIGVGLGGGYLVLRNALLLLQRKFDALYPLAIWSLIA